jgi:XTP/dITP diphosphohydrolase
MNEWLEPTRILIATANHSKAAELRPLLAGFNIRMIADVERFDLDEPGDDYRANAAHKALTASQRTGMVTLADDSGIEVAGLDGEPGYLSARYAGDRCKDDDNRIKLLTAMKDMTGSKRRALFRCTLALADAQGPLGKGIIFAEGIWKGMVHPEDRGLGGFGYDPIFIPDGWEITVAEMSAYDKNLHSHRAQAIASIRPILRSYLRYR